VTEQMLLVLITNLCGKPGLYNSKEKIILCHEYYVNCSVKLSGNIMEYNEFMESCDFNKVICNNGECNKNKPGNRKD
jgi:hypothetical protein